MTVRQNAAAEGSVSACARNTGARHRCDTRVSDKQGWSFVPRTFLRGVAVVTGEAVTTEAQEGFFPSLSALSVTVVSEAAELRRMPEDPGISF